YWLQPTLAKGCRGVLGNSGPSCKEPLYPNIDKHRCHDLKEITSQIKENQSLIMPVIKLQAKKPQATRKLPEQAPTSNPDLETPSPSRRG
ncbi:MAG: hypothetical protein WCR08_10040, partial [Gammaproteobacteria bacterium]